MKCRIASSYRSLKRGLFPFQANLSRAEEEGGGGGFDSASPLRLFSPAGEHTDVREGSKAGQVETISGSKIAFVAAKTNFALHVFKAHLSRL